MFGVKTRKHKLSLGPGCSMTMIAEHRRNNDQDIMKG